MRKLIHTITDLGVHDQLKIEDAQRVRLTNILGIFPALMYMYFIWFGLSNQYYYPPILCSILTVGTIIALWLNSKRKYAVSKTILFSINSFSVLATQNALNIDHSITCYFFPLIIAYEIVFDAKKEWKHFLPTFCFTLLCALGCFLLPHGLIYDYSMSDELLKTSIILNYLFPFVISVFFMFTIINIHAQTQQKLIVAREEAEKALNAKSAFLSNMSHELRTPLNGIIGATNLLMHENLTLSQQRYFDVLQHSSDHMLKLVNDVLDLSKIEVGKVKIDKHVFNLKNVIERVCKNFEQQHSRSNIEFSYSIDELLNQNIISDELRVIQVLNNLLSNAFKFTSAGNVSLHANIHEQTGNHLKVLFSVKDSGIGIKPEQLEKIFEAFTQADSSTTRKFGGTGLGLAISKQLVEILGGQLQVRSNEKMGSEFFFTINVTKDLSAPAQMNTVNINQRQSLKGIKILVAEDNQVNMLILRNFLNKWDAHHIETTNGQEALDQFQKETFDIVLLDLEMPIMDGYSAVNAIKKINPKTPVLAFTAALYDDMANDLKSKGFDSHILKPFKPSDLFEKISTHIT